MKLSTSSSIFLATLALSSSTPTLAAPARDVQESGLTASSSFRDMLGPRAQAASHCSAHRSQPTAARADSFVARTDAVPLTTVIEALSGLPFAGSVIIEMLSTILQPLLGIDGVASQQISAEKLAALQDAIQQITRSLSPTMSKAPAPAQSVIGKTPPIIQAEVESSATSSSAASIFASTTPTHSAAVNNISPSSSASSSASAIPSSPHLPVNPPNTPTLPIISSFNK